MSYRSGNSHDKSGRGVPELWIHGRISAVVFTWLSFILLRSSRKT